MDVKTSNNNYYPINIDCSNPIYKHNEVDKYTNKKISLEKEYKELENKLFETKKKIEETEHKLFCYNFNYYFSESLK